MFDVAMRIDCIHILRCAQADLEGLLSEREEETHPGHETLEEIQLLLEKLEGPVEI
jgi:hypothetical protein